jgi:hypothetical protein
MLVEILTMLHRAVTSLVQFLFPPPILSLGLTNWRRNTFQADCGLENNELALFSTSMVISKKTPHLTETSYQRQSGTLTKGTILLPLNAKSK